MTAFLAAFAGPLLAFAAYCLLAYLVVVAVVPGHRASLARRIRQAGHLLAEAGPWFVGACLTWACRGHSPSPYHPAAWAVTVRGWDQLSEDERREFDEIVAPLKRPAGETERQS